MDTRSASASAPATERSSRESTLQNSSQGIRAQRRTRVLPVFMTIRCAIAHQVQLYKWYLLTSVGKNIRVPRGAVMRRDALDAGVHHEESEILHDEREDNKKYLLSK